MYSDNFQNMYVYSSIKILRGITLAMQVFTDKNGKIFSVKGRDI